MSDKIIQKTIDQLKEYFQKRDDVLMAFLFGSQAKGRAMSGSDWDIAVYFKPAGKIIEFQADRDFTQESEVWGDLIDILQTDNVDLIVLNRAPATLADAAIEGEPLVIKDRGLFTEFMLRVTSEAIDFRQTVKEYAEVYWRSASLNEKDVEIVRKRLIFLNSELNDIEKFYSLDQFAYENDNAKRREAERLIENLMNAAIDISKTFLASEKRTVPGSYKEILRSLYLIPNFSKTLGEQLSEWAELRNILAHEYPDIRWKRIEDFLKRSQPYFEELINGAKDFMLKNKEGV
ncbi:MAG: DUF86 domain-containing protein [bacterium]|nr:DUF86 domain-containing protein [bacterium]